AEKAGLKPYDVILAFNGKPVRNSVDLVQAVTQVPINATAPMKLSRNGKVMELQVTVSVRPGSPVPGKEEGKKKKRRRAKVDTGMEVEDITPESAKELGLEGETKGVLVSRIAYGGPADEAGLLRGDLILEVDRKPVKSVDGFYSVVKEKKSYLLRVRRADP